MSSIRFKRTNAFLHGVSDFFFYMINIEVFEINVCIEQRPEVADNERLASCGSSEPDLLSVAPLPSICSQKVCQ